MALHSPSTRCAAALTKLRPADSLGTATGVTVTRRAARIRLQGDMALPVMEAHTLRLTMVETVLRVGPCQRCSQQQWGPRKPWSVKCGHVEASRRLHLPAQLPATTALTAILAVVQWLAAFTAPQPQPALTTNLQHHLTLDFVGHRGAGEVVTSGANVRGGSRDGGQPEFSPGHGTSTRVPRTS